MPLRINTNVPALNSKRILNITGKDLNMRIERLASGLRVNRASDDAASLNVSEGIRAEASGFAQGIRNSEQAVNLIQTADGALGEINGLMLRMRELAVQSASSTVNDDNREAINAEFVQLRTEIDRIAEVTSYNNTSLLSGYGNTVSQDTSVSTALASATTGVTKVQISGAQTGTYTFLDTAGDSRLTLGNGTVTQTLNISQVMDADDAGTVVATGSTAITNFDRLGIQLILSGQNTGTDGYRDGDLDGLVMQIEAGTGGTFQVGPDEGAVHRLEVNVGDMRASGLNLSLSSTSVSTLSSAQDAIPEIDRAINEVVKTRGDLGAVQNRLTFNMRANASMLESDRATDSTLRDADIAQEVSAFTRSQILTQAGLAVFAQANISTASALTLL